MPGIASASLLSQSLRPPYQGDLVLQPLLVRLRAQEQAAEHPGLEGHLRTCLQQRLWLTATRLPAPVRKQRNVLLHGFHRLDCHAERLKRMDGVTCSLVHHNEVFRSVSWQ